jgi:hypothetical protein
MFSDVPVQRVDALLSDPRGRRGEALVSAPGRPEPTKGARQERGGELSRHNPPKTRALL